MNMLMEEPEFLSAWFSVHRLDFALANDHVVWNRNPVDVLAETYHLLHLDDQPGEPATHRIWEHDQHLLDTARRFYAKLDAHVPGGTSWAELDRALLVEGPSFGFDARTWACVRAAHAGHQLGL